MIGQPCPGEVSTWDMAQWSSATGVLRDREQRGHWRQCNSKKFTHGQLKKFWRGIGQYLLEGNKGGKNPYLEQVDSEFGCNMELQTNEERKRLLKCVN